MKIKGWTIQEAGWYISDPEGCGVSKEMDGLWHAFIDRSLPPGTEPSRR